MGIRGDRVLGVRKWRMPAAMIAAMITVVAVWMVTEVVAATDENHGSDTATTVPGDVWFVIGTPDNCAAEFGATDGGYISIPQCFSNPVEFTVGRSETIDFPYLHPSERDEWAGGVPWSVNIRFDLPDSPDSSVVPMQLVLGLCGGHSGERSMIVVTANGETLPSQMAPEGGDMTPCFHPGSNGRVQIVFFEIPAGTLRLGENEISIRLERMSWIIYDYVALRERREPLPIRKAPEPELRAAAIAAMEEDSAATGGPRQIVFCERIPGPDGHWYANFGYYADAKLSNAYFGNGGVQEGARVTYRNGGRLNLLELDTGRVMTLIDDPDGALRDPCVDYDGKRILFSWRKGGQSCYHLYEIGVDGTGLRRLTNGEFDDIEPAYLPDGDIVFVSSRCRRWVNCWVTQVATLHRCGPNGENIRELSSNNEHDNTPSILLDGRILYTRWEYIDRSQVQFHHLWTTTPDGVRQTTFFGNLHAGTTMIDAKSIPGSERIVASFSPGHGQREHDGVVTLVDPRYGPDDQRAVRSISRDASYRDPWAFSESLFLAARNGSVVLMDSRGRTQTLYTVSDADRAIGMECHEPRPVMLRPREPVVTEQTHLESPTGRMVVTDVYRGRNMGGVARGEIKKLLVLETLPKPINFTGGMEPLSYGGTFTLERILGTVPVAEDGSAYFELPALRSVIFVALDENDLAVKRMQSFTSVMPGETQTCIGCHESRTETPVWDVDAMPMALAAPLARITPSTVPGETDPAQAAMPDVLDFPRDVQPILDNHCFECHNPDRPEAGLNLTGDRGPMYTISYYAITAHSLVADGRNAYGNRPPRTMGSSASRLMQVADEHHYGVQLSPRERMLLRLWIDSGAPYPGTYAALGSGMIGGYAENQLDRSDLAWASAPAHQEAMIRRCGGCHGTDGDLKNVLPQSVSDEIINPPWEPWTGPDDARLRYSRNLVYDLTQPEKSTLLLAPLAKSAGGRGVCPGPVFADADDSDYQLMLTYIIEAKRRLDTIRRFDMPDFVPRPEYTRELRRYGILSPSFSDGIPYNTYEAEQRYWRSLWQTGR